jgi:hypothetical protein
LTAGKSQLEFVPKRFGSNPAIRFCHLPSPPADDTSLPLADNTSSPPADDISLPPAEDVSSPSADDTSSPPADDASSPPAEDTSSPPADDLDHWQERGNRIELDVEKTCNLQIINTM